jgi:hypothetical protein
MLKSGYKKMAYAFYRKPCNKVRIDYDWPEIFPCPRPSFTKKIIKKTCDFVYMNVDAFFRGYPDQQKADNANCLPGSDKDYRRDFIVWELNQGVADIAYKDITECLNWLTPGFVRQFIYWLYKEALIYFFADTLIEGDASDPEDIIVSKADPENWNRGKVIYFMQEFRNTTNYKSLAISEWLVKFYFKLRLVFGFNSDKKTYHLLGHFALGVYDYNRNNQSCTIRGPDKTNFNTSFSFHKRN